MQCGLISGIKTCIMKLKWKNSNVATSPIFDGLLFSTVCFTWCFYSWNQSTLHIKSNLYFVYWVLLCFVFFKDMHYNTMIRTFCILEKNGVQCFSLPDGLSDQIVGLRECWLKFVGHLSDILGGICRTWVFDRWYTWCVL
jgi:hypothetical protein